MRHFIDTQFPVIFPIFFVVLWCTIGLLAAYLTGWAALARRFRLTAPFTGETWSWQSARMRWSTHYGGCLTVGADPSGLYLSVLFPFRIGHPPLFLPWHEVSVWRRWKVLGLRNVELRLGQEEQLPFQISGNLADRIQAAAGSSWPVEAAS
jgi:hypothetical protein